MPFAHHRGCRLYYELAGETGRPVLVLIRGLGRSSRHWGPLVPLLAPHLRLLLLDNRGVGRSDAPWPPYTTAQLARDVAAVMDAAGIARAHVFGMSLGGMIAQHLALAYPDRVDRLIIGCSTAGGQRAHATPARSQRTMLRAAFGDHGPLGELLVSEVTAAQRAHWDELRRIEPLRFRGFVGQAIAARRHDTYARLGEIAQPTLVLTGDDDAIIPPANSQLLAARIPRAKLVILPGARHDFTADRPADAVRALLEFLR
jgi:3-oxoadipate enol-lactonase